MTASRRFVRIGIQHIFALTLLLCSATINLVASDRSSIVDLAAAGDWRGVEALIREGAEVNAVQGDGMSALHWAAKHSQSRAVGLLLQAKADANAETAYSMTPLAIAAMLDSPKVVELLLEANAEANKKLPGNTTLLMLASRTGNPKIVQLLAEQNGVEVDAQERSGQTALMWAAAEGNAEAVDVLLMAGADPSIETPNGFNALMFATREGHMTVVKSLLEHGADLNYIMKPQKSGKRIPRKGTSPLLMAVESAHYELAMMLVSHGADPNDLRNGFSPLHIMASVRKPKRGEEPDGDPPRRGSGSLTALQFVRALVAAGADVNLRMKGGQKGKATLGHKGATPILLAGKTCDLPYLQLLLELGADPTITNEDGCTALMAAAGVGVKAVGEEPGTVEEVKATIDFFIEHGVDVNARDANGETAMHGAAYRNFPEVVKHLAKRGAAPKIWDKKNKWGWTPVMIAQGKRPGSFKPSPPTVAALKAAGAK